MFAQYLPPVHATSTAAPYWVRVVLVAAVVVFVVALVLLLAARDDRPD